MQACPYAKCYLIKLICVIRMPTAVTNRDYYQAIGLLKGQPVEVTISLAAYMACRQVDSAQVADDPEAVIRML